MQTPYPDRQRLEDDTVYFLKKMHWEQADLDTYLARPPQPHDRYGSEKAMGEFCSNWYMKLIHQKNKA